MFDGLIEVERTDTDIVVVPGAFLGIRKNVDLAIELAEIEGTRKVTLIFNGVSIRVESDNRIDRENWSAHMKALAQRQLASIDTQDAAGVH